MREKGYDFDTSALHEHICAKADSRLLKEILTYHCEKKALAAHLGLTSEKVKKAFAIVNVRMCVDCHEIYKAVSDVYGIRIACRDGARMHRFQNGECACEDDND
mmetsp:Transcript_4917/g.7493  ORF Transcript_4917/g.7493 Transcript_4917/m.7493 type:complete len:104 (-) Transcript_4917:125-436(-)